MHLIKFKLKHKCFLEKDRDTGLSLLQQNDTTEKLNVPKQTQEFLFLLLNSQPAEGFPKGFSLSGNRADSSPTCDKTHHVFFPELPLVLSHFK